MPIKKCVLDGEKILSLQDVYKALAQQLDFPEHFGRNLDALWDVLTTDLPGPISITWKSSIFSRSALGEGYEKVVAVLKEAAKERDDLTVRFK